MQTERSSLGRARFGPFAQKMLFIIILHLQKMSIYFGRIGKNHANFFT
jgi:hypothetical protein